MNAARPTLLDGDRSAILALVERLVRTERQLQEPTLGDVGSIIDPDDRVHLLRHVVEQLRTDVVARQVAVLDALPMPVAILDPGGCIVSANAAWRQTGDAGGVDVPGHAPGSNYLAACDHTYPTDSGEAQDIAAGIRAVLDGASARFSFDYACPLSGDQRWFSATVAPIHDGARAGAVVMRQEITVHRRQEQALRELRTAMDTIRDGIFIIDRGSMRFVDCNVSACAMLGYTRAELLERGPADVSLAPPDRIERIYDEVIAGLATNDPTETTLRRKDGSLFTAEASRRAQRAGNGWIIVGVLRDITEHRFVESALRASMIEQQQLAALVEVERSRLASAQSVAKIGSWETQVERMTTIWSLETHRIFETDPDTFHPTHESFLRLVHPLDRAMVDRSFAESLARGGSQTIEHRLLLVSGRVKTVEERWQVYRDADGRAIRALGTCQDITERVAAQAALKDGRDRLALATESACIGIWDWNVVADRMTWDSRMHALYGVREEDVSGRCRDWIAGIHQDDRGRIEAEIAAALAGERPFDALFRVALPDGGVRHIEAHATVRRAADGSAERMIGVSWDVSERERAATALKRLNRMHAVLSHINDLIVRVTDRDELFHSTCRIAVEDGEFLMSLVCVVDRATGSIVPVATGGKSDELIAAIRETLAHEALGPRTMVARAIATQACIVSNDIRRDPAVLLAERYVQAGIRSLVVVPMIVANEGVGVIALYAGTTDYFHRDELKLLSNLAANVAFAFDHIEKAERLNYLAYYDHLTGLANQSLFVERVAQFIRGAGAPDDRIIVLVMDLERFREINDVHGQAAGDSALRQVAEVLKVELGDDNLLARLGADRFAMVLPPMASDGDPTQRVATLVTALQAREFRYQQSTMRFDARYGVALFPLDGRDAATLLRNAEVALKLAKSRGERCVYHSREQHERHAQQRELERQLRVAIEQQQFVLHYQARVDMISGEMVGAEALIRWEHPERGLLNSGDFIALAEASGLIVPIGAWVMDTVCAQQSAWLAAGVAIVPIAVNLSPLQFEQGDLLASIRSTLSRHALAPRHIDLELTESAVMDDAEAAARTLGVLRRLGVGLSLDDFGTGYSSLAHLKRFPFNSVKLDKSFVSDITSNANDATIASAIIAMAHRLGLKVVAEGVETQGQFNYLRSQFCDEMQGHLFSPAVPQAQFERQLRTGERLPLPEPAAAGQRTLLLVDDDPGIRAALIRMLRRDGYHILSAGSGLEGLELLALHPVQVIISDQRMPGMTGTEFLNTVKQMYPDTMRIILSGFTDLETVTESVNLGAVFKFLTKPWNDDALREQVRDAFRRYRPASGPGDVVSKSG